MSEAEDILAHYGVKGMKWGVQNDKDPLRSQSSNTTIDPTLDPVTKNASAKMARLMNERYGFKITSVTAIHKDNPEYDYGTVGYVIPTPGQTGGAVHIRSGDLTEMLKHSEDVGWFAKGTGNVEALITHESAHALFHASQQTVNGFTGVKTVGGGAHDPRKKALKAAIKAAKKDGIHPYYFTHSISGYAGASGTREEAEAEMFAQYHWSENPPNFIKVWGKTLHQEMGIDDTPFREVG